jgi:(R,R)-butanediol dehydrogenase/meso-butanediol dehydrogenase/diacetyl reductase
MKSVRFYGIQDVRFEDIPKPEYNKNQVLIKVAYGGICGSDLHIYNKGMFVLHVPETMGHEFVGTIEETGSSVTDYEIGETVTANPMLPCMECQSCRKGMYNTCEGLSFIGEARQGCFAEYIAIDASKLIKIGKTGQLKKFALIEPLAVAMNVSKRADWKVTDKIVIMGAGPIGCMLAAVAKQIYKVSSVTMVDLSAERLALAKKVGADMCLNDAQKLDSDYNKIVDCAGAPQTVAAATEHLDTDGTLYIVSIFEKNTAVDCNLIVNKQLRICGCNVYAPEDMDAAAKALLQGDLDIETLITDTFKPEECSKAFSILAGGVKSSSKILFDFTN